MRAVVTRVASASVQVEGTTIGAIERGFLILLGVGPRMERHSVRLWRKNLGPAGV